MKLQQILRRYIRKQFPQPRPHFGANCKKIGYVTFDPITNTLDVDAESLYAVEICNSNRDSINSQHPDTIEEINILCDKIEDYVNNFIQTNATNQNLMCINSGCISVARMCIPIIDEVIRQRREKRMQEALKNVYGDALKYN